MNLAKLGLQLQVVEGKMVCPSCQREFAIRASVANMASTAWTRSTLCSQADRLAVLQLLAEHELRK